MSFSSEVKQELAKQISKSRHCQLAELSGIIHMSGGIDQAEHAIVLESENPVLIQKYALLMKRAFGINISKAITAEDTSNILAALKITELPINRQTTDGRLIMQTCCKRAFIRGAFMAAGSISDPNKAYHFEIVCHTVEQAQQIQEILKSFDTDAKIVERKSHHVVYLKEGAHIVDSLNIMEAYVALMKLENVRILKEMRNSVNRKVNCETANISKTVNAAVKQIEDIELIKQKIGLKGLPEPLRQMAQLRLEYPEAPLKELGGYLSPPVGKSGVNHRLRKLSSIAEELR